MAQKLNFMKGSTLSKKTIGKILIVGLAILIVVVTLIVVIIWSDFKKVIWQPAPPHQVESLESFELVWSSSVSSPRVMTERGSVRNPLIYMYLDASENQLILPIWEGNLLFSKLYLTDFELNTGEIKWQTQLDSNELALVNNSKNIFAVVQETEKCTIGEQGYCDAVRISSYDIFSGEEEWVTYHGKLNRANTIDVNDEILSISGFATRSDFREKVSFAVDTGDKLVYQDISPKLDGYLEDWNPSLLGISDSAIVFGSYAQNGKFLFFLTEDDNTLWAVDQDVPEIVGRVRFDGTSFEGINYVNRFAVASENDMVVVYLGDGEQLFVFRFSPSSK